MKYGNTKLTVTFQCIVILLGVKIFLLVDYSGIISFYVTYANTSHISL